MTNEEIRQIALEQSAIDLNCTTEDLNSDGNTVVLSKENASAKRYITGKPFCVFVSYGNGMVASVDSRIELAITEFVATYDYFRCFDLTQIIKLNSLIVKYAKAATYMTQFFLPDLSKEIHANDEVVTKIFRGTELTELYSHKGFDMALEYDNKSNKRDVIALAGYIDDELVGICGASNDSDTMWQVGIDVIKKHRGKGIAKTLVSKLTHIILDEGIIPFYGTAWSNVSSIRTAISSGYRPGWIELTAKDINELEGLINKEIV